LTAGQSFFQALSHITTPPISAMANTTMMVIPMSDFIFGPLFIR
jgi:hypothetical protein